LKRSQEPSEKVPSKEKQSPSRSWNQEPNKLHSARASCKAGVARDQRSVKGEYGRLEKD